MSNPSSPTPAVETLSDSALAEIEARANMATPGPWESDNEQDSEHRYQYYMALDAESRTIFDTLNSSIGEIHEEADEGGVYRWDEVARRNIAFAAHARIDIPALCQAVRAAWAELKLVNACPWCGSEMERVPVDGGDELGCTSEQCPSFGVGVWCYADLLKKENAALREQLAEAQEYGEKLARNYSSLEGWILRIRIKLGLPARNAEIEDAIEALQSQLAQAEKERDDLRTLLRDLAPVCQSYFPVTGLAIYNLKQRIDATLKGQP